MLKSQSSDATVTSIKLYKASQIIWLELKWLALRTWYLHFKATLDGWLFFRPGSVWVAKKSHTGFETETSVLLWNLSLWRIAVTWNLHSGYLKFELVNFSVNCRLWLLCFRLTGILYIILRSKKPYIVSVLVQNCLAPSP